MNVIPPITITAAMLTASSVYEVAPDAYVAGTTYHWDVSTGVYAGKKLLVASQEIAPSGVTFSVDGTKAYIIGYGSNTIYQYTLAIPWDISTGSYASKSLSVAAQDNASMDIAFSVDGTKAYVIGYTNDTICQYTLATPWDISTGSYASKSLSVAAQETFSTGLAFSVDGTKAYVAGYTNNTVYQYTLATPWDISTGSYASKSMSVVAQETTLRAIAFSSDGTKVHVIGGVNNTIYQYNLSTAWDISTGSYASKSLSVVAQENSQGGLAISVDGAHVYILGGANDTIYQYDVTVPTVSVTSITSVHDIDEGVYSFKSLFVNVLENDPIGLAFSEDGTKAYVVGFTNATVFQYTLSTAWDISTGVSAGKNMSVVAQQVLPNSIAFSTDGAIAYVTGTSPSRIHQYTLSIPWDISTGTYASKNLLVAAQDASPNGLAFSADGSKAYIAGNSNDAVFQYTLSTPWDISTGSYASKSMSVAAQDTSPNGLAFSTDGAKAYVIGTASDTIYQYNLSTAWDISTGSYASKSLSVAAQDIGMTNITIGANGAKVYVMGNYHDSIYQYDISESNKIAIYRSVQATNAGHPPTTSPTWWTNIGETYPVYSVSTTYALAYRVVDINSHLVYESLVAGNLNQPLTNTAKWLAIGSTNKWATFDLLRNTKTVVPLQMQVKIAPGVRTDSIALMGVVADRARVTVLRGGEIFYDHTEDLSARSADDWVDYAYPALPTDPSTVLFDLPVEYDLSTGSYASKSLSVVGQTAYPNGLTFSSDGTKVYIVNDTGTVFQYALSTAWDISTGSYASKSLSVAAQDTSPRGIAFSVDGTKAYIVGIVNDAIYQYTLSTAWDISTGSYASKSLSVAAQDTAPYDLTFSSDGTKVYIIGNTNNTVYQYALATPWDISTGSYASKSLSVAAQEVTPHGAVFSADGTKVFVVGTVSDTIYQYNLSTAWDISTGSYASKSLSVAAQDTSPNGLALSANGGKIYIIGDNNNAIYQYTLPPTSSHSGVIQVELYAATGNVELGACVLGNAVYLGEVQSGGSADVLNFSTVTRDFAGDTSLIVQRRNIPKINQQLLLPNTRINAVRAVRDYLNAIPAVWVGLEDISDPRFESLLILGFYKRFSFQTSSLQETIIDLEIEEI